MRISKTISITLPPDMLKRAMKMAKEEDRSMSELLRAAFREYEFRTALQRVHRSSSARRTRQRIQEEDIVDLIKKERKKLWPTYKKKYGLGKSRKTQ